MSEVHSRRRGLLLASGLFAVWLLFGFLRFDQGLDLSAHGRWALGAALERSGTVHALIDTGDGPLPYQVLGVWMRIDGERWGALAHLLAVLHALAAALLAVWTLRRGVAALLLGQLTLLAASPLDFAALWAVSTALIWALLPGRLRPAFWGGLLGAGLLTLDATWAVALLPAAAAALLARPGWRAHAAAGLATGFGLLLVTAMAGSAPLSTVTNALAGPWERLADGFAFSRTFESIRAGAWLDRPFAGLATGEFLDAAWPGHAFLRAWGLRLGAVLVLIAPLLWLRHRREAATGLALLAATVLLVLRGDVPSIVLALVLVTAAGTGYLSRRWRPALVTALALAVATPAVENLWLAAQRSRPTLAHWDTPRVGVRLDARRMQALQSGIRELHLHPEQPALIWPDLAGLHFLLQTVPVVPALSVDPSVDGELARALKQDPPPIVLFAPSPSLLPQNRERTLPESSAVLRRDYRLRGSVPAGGLNLRVIAEGAHPTDPLGARLPRIECMVPPSVEDLGPALRHELILGQTFRLEGDDMRGFAIRLVTAADSVDVELRTRLWAKPGSEFTTMMEARTLRLVARRDQPMHFVHFPVVESTGQELGLFFEVEGTPTSEVRFAWHENSGRSGLGDVYPEGEVLLGFDPVDADLVFLIY